MISVPNSLNELLTRANYLSGYSISTVADAFNLSVPADLKRHKGWIGNFIEHVLGADAGSKAIQDFTELKIELKTIPVNDKYFPLETTFVSLAPLTGNVGVTWDTSHVRNKLQRVLWMPIQGNRDIPIKDRLIGKPILWEPSLQESITLKKDWEELTELITLGQFDKINAAIGEVLQLRPKGANRKSRTHAYDSSGKLINTLPLGFYLRTGFTGNILQKNKM